jgi:hypothetical protein
MGTWLSEVQVKDWRKSKWRRHFYLSADETIDEIFSSVGLP